MFGGDNPGCRTVHASSHYDIQLRITSLIASCGVCLCPETLLSSSRGWDGQTSYIAMLTVPRCCFLLCADHLHVKQPRNGITRAILHHGSTCPGSHCSGFKDSPNQYRHPQGVGAVWWRRWVWTSLWLKTCQPVAVLGSEPEHHARNHRCPCLVTRQHSLLTN